MNKPHLQARPVLPYKKWSTHALRWRLLSLRTTYTAQGRELEVLRAQYFQALQAFEATSGEMEEISLVLDQRDKLAHSLQGKLRHCHFAGREEWNRLVPADQKARSPRSGSTVKKKTPEQQVQAALQNLSPAELLALVQGLVEKQEKGGQSA